MNLVAITPTLLIFQWFDRVRFFTTASPFEWMPIQGPNIYNCNVKFLKHHSEIQRRSIYAGVSPPKANDANCIFPLISAKLINSTHLIIFVLLVFFGLPPTLTMMHLRITLYMYWTPLLLWIVLARDWNIEMCHIEEVMGHALKNCALFHVIFRARFIVSLRPSFLHGPGLGALLSSYLEGVLYKFYR